jgi:hypothetical protein
MALLQLFWNICLFHKGPQDAPASPLLLKFVLSAYLVVGLALSATEVPWWEGILQVALEAAILLAFAWLSLAVAAKTSRWLQTSIAMLGTDALLSSFALPLKLLLFFAGTQANFLHLLLLLLMLWQIGVVAHILRHALAQTYAMGVALAIVYVLFSLQALVLLFGPPG